MTLILIYIIGVIATSLWLDGDYLRFADQLDIVDRLLIILLWPVYVFILLIIAKV